MEISKDKVYDLIKNFDKDQLKKVYEYTIKINNKKIIIQPITKKEIDKTTEKYKFVLKIINKILQNIGKNQIEDLINFVNIDRNDIIKNENNQFLFEMEKEIFKVFDRSKCGWYRRKTTKNYILTFLRYSCEEIGFEFTSTQKEKTDDRGNKRTHFLYSIK
jgi:hypothetical protein